MANQVLSAASCRVFIVEDDPIFADYIRCILRGMDIPSELMLILEKVTRDKGVGLEFWNDLEGEDLNELF